MVKRAAAKQITKDDTEAGFSDSDDGGEQAGFRKAAPEVLRQRRILKVRRTGASGAPKSDATPLAAATNPFASLTAAPSATNPFAQLPPTKPSERKDPASEEDSPSVAAPTPAPFPVPTPTTTPSVSSEPINKPIPTDSTLENETKPDDKPAQPTTASTTPVTAEPGEKDSTEATTKENKATENKEQSTPEPNEKKVETLVKPAEDTKSSKVNDASTAGPIDSVVDAKPKADDDNAKSCDDNAKPVLKDVAASEKTTKTAKEPSPKKPAPFVFGGVGAAKTSFADAASTKETGFSFLPKATASVSVPLSVNKPKAEYTEQTVTTGEEGEKTEHKIRAKVFILEGSEWRERGVGLLKLNVYEGGARLLLRTEATYRLALNAPLYPSLNIDRAGERGIRFKDLAGGSVFLCRVPTKDDVNALVAAIETERKKLPVEK